MAIEQLVGDPAIMDTRNKEIVLRLLDAKKIEAGRSKWQALNIALPLLILALFGGLFHWMRKKQFGAA
jgi:hypothetical protein